MSKLVNELFGPRKVEPQHGASVIILSLLILFLIAWMLWTEKEPETEFHSAEFSMHPFNSERMREPWGREI